MRFAWSSVRSKWSVLCCPCDLLHSDVTLTICDPWSLRCDTCNPCDPSDPCDLCYPCGWCKTCCNWVLPLFNTRIWDFSTAANGSHGSQGPPGSHGTQDLLGFTVYQFHLQVSRLPFKRQIKFTPALKLLRRRERTLVLALGMDPETSYLPQLFWEHWKFDGAPPNSRKGTTPLFASAFLHLTFFLNFFLNPCPWIFETILAFDLFKKKNRNGISNERRWRTGTTPKAEANQSSTTKQVRGRGQAPPPQSGEGGTQHRPKGESLEELPLCVTLPSPHLTFSLVGLFAWWAIFGLVWPCDIVTLLTFLNVVDFFTIVDLGAILAFFFLMCFCSVFGLLDVCGLFDLLTFWLFFFPFTLWPIHLSTFWTLVTLFWTYFRNFSPFAPFLAFLKFF